MARKPRIEYPGAFYHIMARGNNREFILQNDEDKELYLYLIKKYKHRYYFNIYAYCIMDNHVHLLIETADVPLSKIMQGIQQSFTQTYNRKYERTGHVFQQRYKALLCDRDSYLLQLVKYIHYNPVEACIHEGLSYRWSSHREYLNANEKSVVEVKLILQMLGQDISGGLSEYKKFMSLDQGKLDINEFLLDKEEVHIKRQRQQMKTVTPIAKHSIMDVVRCVCETTGLSIEEITKKSKSKKYVNARKAIVLLCSKHTDITNIEIGRIIKLSPSVIARIKGDVVDEEVSSLLDNVKLGIAPLQS